MKMNLYLNRPDSAIGIAEHKIMMRMTLSDVVLHCLGSARLICHEIDQFGYLKERGGHTIRVRECKVHSGKGLSTEPQGPQRQPRYNGPDANLC